MRFLVAPEFSKKIVAAAAEVRAEVGNFLVWLEGTTENDLISKSSTISQGAQGAIYAYRGSGTTRILYSFGTDREGRYVLLVDALINAAPSISASFAARNPMFDTKVNPKFNTQINPTFNSQLNPMFNSQINPMFNSQINPMFNSQINPMFNSTININFNSSINPNFNSAINPRFNWSISPRTNHLFGGPFLYDLNTNRMAYVVAVNEQVLLVFSMDGDLEKFAVRSNHGYVVFDRANNWIEHWADDRQGGYLRFDRNNQWIGFVV